MAEPKKKWLMREVDGAVGGAAAFEATKKKKKTGGQAVSNADAKRGGRAVSDADAKRGGRAVSDADVLPLEDEPDTKPLPPMKGDKSFKQFMEDTPAPQKKKKKKKTGDARKAPKPQPYHQDTSTNKRFVHKSTLKKYANSVRGVRWPEDWEQQ